MKKIRTKYQKGIFLISSYLALSVVGTFSLALFLKNVTIYHAAERAESRIRAFHQAESGIDQAIVRLRSDLSYQGQGYSPLGNNGGYEVLVDAPDPSQPTLRRITGTGHSPSNALDAYAYVQRQIVSYVTFTPSTGGYGIFSDTSIQMSGNVHVDSYDSRRGPYNRYHPGTNGDMGTNTTRAGFVMMSGNAKVHGDVTVGPGGNPARVIVTSGNVQIYGSRTAAPSLRVLEPVQIPSHLTNLGTLTVNGNDSLTLPGGNYFYSSINISGNGRVNFRNPTTLYVSGDVKITGNGTLTAQDLPSNLEIKMKGNRPIEINGNGDYFGRVYAPASNVVVTGNGSIFGEAVGKTIQASGNGSFHYDEALADGTSNSSVTADMLAWAEL